MIDRATFKAAATAFVSSAELAPDSMVNAEERHALIAEIAYLLAEARDFSGDPADYWLWAEKQIDSAGERMAALIRASSTYR